MADVKISELTALASANVDASGDVLAVVDTSATATRKITVENLLAPITINKASNVITNLGTVSAATSITSSAFVGPLTGNVTGNVSGTAPAGTLTGSTLASGVTASSLESLGTLTALTGGTGDLIWDTTTLVVDSSANSVGIGIAVPATSLHVYKADNTWMSIDAPADKVASLALKSAGTNEWEIYRPASSGDLRFYETGAGDRVTFKAGGSVGIGTGSPTSTRKMTIQEGSSQSAAIHFTDTDTMDQGIVGNARGADDIVTGTANNDFVVGSTYSQSTHIISNETIKMTVTSAGNVGIGEVPDSASRLLVDHDQNSYTRILVKNTDTGSAAQAVNHYETDVGSFTVGAVSDAHSLDGSALLWHVPNKNMVFATNNTERMRITSAGAIGGGEYRYRSSGIAGTTTVTITNPQTVSGGNHWDMFTVVFTMSGINGNISGDTFIKWYHKCTGLTAWSLSTGVAIIGSVPSMSQGTASATQLVCIIDSGSVPDNATLTVEVFSHDMLANCDIIFS